MARVGWDYTERLHKFGAGPIKGDEDFLSLQANRNLRVWRIVYHPEGATLSKRNAEQVQPESSGSTGRRRSDLGEALHPHKHTQTPDHQVTICGFQNNLTQFDKAVILQFIEISCLMPAVDTTFIVPRPRRSRDL